MALCIKCGHKKLGTWTPCRRCGFSPDGEEDRAKSILLSDHNLTADQLGVIGKKIEAGEPITFNEDSLREFATSIPVAEPKYIFGVRATSWAALGIAIPVGIIFGSCNVAVFHFFHL